MLFLLYSFIHRDHFAEGKRLYELNRFEEGLASFDMAIKHNPTDLNAFTGRGVCLRKLNRFEEGLASFDMAIKHDPTNLNAFTGRGVCLHELLSVLMKH